MVQCIGLRLSSNDSPLTKIIVPWANIMTRSPGLLKVLSRCPGSEAGAKESTLVEGSLVGSIKWEKTDDIWLGEAVEEEGVPPSEES